jgi:hypothetical protein
LRLTDETVGAVTPRAAVRLVVPVPLGVVAVIVSDLSEATAEVVTVKVAVVAPPATTTEAGTVADGSLDDKVTVTEPEAATGASSVTVPVEFVPPTTGVVLIVIDLRNGVHT